MHCALVVVRALHPPPRVSPQVTQSNGVRLWWASGTGGAAEGQSRARLQLGRLAFASLCCLPAHLASLPSPRVLARMKVVGLVSGGKDSCYSLCRAAAAGHDVVAVAHLTPADQQQEETDSHCFQTVAHAIVPHIAKCIGVPCYTRGIGTEADAATAHAARIRRATLNVMFTSALFLAFFPVSQPVAAFTPVWATPLPCLATKWRTWSISCATCWPRTPTCEAWLWARS